jgi:hypothetical protein
VGIVNNLPEILINRVVGGVFNGECFNGYSLNARVAKILNDCLAI